LASLPSSVLGQTEDFTAFYYPKINEAELAITRNDIQEALQHYKAAFSSVKTSFARDYRNAAICAMQTNEEAFALSCVEKLIAKSLHKDYFQDTIFASLREKNGWKKLMAQFDQRYFAAQASINQQYLGELSAMADRDQYFRQMEGSYEVYGDTIAKIDHENVARFRQLVELYGFPSESIIGTFVDAAAPWTIVVHHQAQQLSNPDYKYPKSPSLAPILQQAAKFGQCDPTQAGFLLSLENDKALNYNAWGIHQSMVDGKKRDYYLLDKVADDQIAAVNALRAGIGMESLDDFRIKCQFRLDHPNTPFKLTSHRSINVWDFDEAMANDFEPLFEKIAPTLKN
jgi:hypothetical protein